MKFLFSVYDTKAAVFSNPFTSVNKFTAIRDFQNAVNDPQSNISQYPDDYILYELGSFDDITGEVTASTPIVSLGPAAQFKI